jgi:hypothetical protein
VTLGAAGAIAGDPDTAFAIDYATPGAVDLGDNFDFAGQAPFSVEAWIDPTAFDGNFHMIASKWQQPPNRKGFELFHLDGRVTFSRELDDATSDIAAATGLVTGSYTHVVATYDGAMLRLFFNGAQVATAASTLLLPDIPNPFQIGEGNNRSAFGGSIDEVAIYGAALPAARVNAHDAAARGRSGR